MDVLKLVTDAKDTIIAAKDCVIAAKDREIALTVRALQLEVEAAKRESAERQRENEQQRREIEQLKSAHAKELEAQRNSLGYVQAALERALQEERARQAEQAAVARYRHEQRRLWLRSPDCVLLVLSLVAFNGHPAWNFASLSRAFRGDEVLWGCIKDRCGDDGETFLMACSCDGDLARVQWLLDRGANVNAGRTNDGMTSLMWASTNGHLKIVRELVGRGANVNAAQTDDGMTSLMWACFSGHVEIVRELLERGANVNAAQTNNGMTSLMWACTFGYKEVARLLLAHHASKTALSRSGKTAYALTPAAYKELRELVKP